MVECPGEGATRMNGNGGIPFLGAYSMQMRRLM